MELICGASESGDFSFLQRFFNKNHYDVFVDGAVSVVGTYKLIELINSHAPVIPAVAKPRWDLFLDVYREDLFNSVGSVSVFLFRDEYTARKSRGSTAVYSSFGSKVESIAFILSEL